MYKIPNAGNTAMRIRSQIGLGCPDRLPLWEVKFPENMLLLSTMISLG